ncbi:MAG: hypothetical protein WC783_02915 [Candidatus Paceibacterota bacterium]|jgi:hypothetical protein
METPKIKIPTDIDNVYNGDCFIFAGDNDDIVTCIFMRVVPIKGHDPKDVYYVNLSTGHIHITKKTTKVIPLKVKLYASGINRFRGDTPTIDDEDD